MFRIVSWLEGVARSCPVVALNCFLLALAYFVLHFAVIFGGILVLFVIVG